MSRYAVGVKAYRHWLTMKEPHWANVQYSVNYQDYLTIQHQKETNFKFG
jgi:hypothetical protein